MATDRTERLLNLVICLLGAQRPLSRSSLRAAIPGYSHAASSDAFERMFERDKEELRQMGIPIDTVLNAQGEVEGYRIDQDAYAMPALSLDPAELAVLGLAARMWTEAALAAEASAALRKIEATTGQTWSPPALISSRPQSGEEVLPALWEAIRSRRVVRFTYLARGREDMQVRDVEPWATVYREGAWYLVGSSRERGEARAFRLSRIHGDIEVLREGCEHASREVIERAAESISGPLPRATAQVRLPLHGSARLKDRARQRDDGLWEVDYADDAQVVAEVVESGGVIVGPESLAQRQRQVLLRVLEAHGG